MKPLIKVKPRVQTERPTSSLNRKKCLLKPDRPQPTEIGDYRPISLNFMLRTMKRLIDRYLMNVSLIQKPLLQPLQKRQHAYQTGKFVVMALVAGALLDVEGAFNHTTTAFISKRMEAHGTTMTLSRWIESMISNRWIEANWGSSKNRDSQEKLPMRSCAVSGSRHLRSGQCRLYNW